MAMMQFRSRVYRAGIPSAFPDRITSRKKVYERIAYLAEGRARGENTVEQVVVECREHGPLSRWQVYETIHISPDGSLS